MQLLLTFHQISFMKSISFDVPRAGCGRVGTSSSRLLRSRRLAWRGRGLGPKTLTCLRHLRRLWSSSVSARPSTRGTSLKETQLFRSWPIITEQLTKKSDENCAKLRNCPLTGYRVKGLPDDQNGESSPSERSSAVVGITERSDLESAPIFILAAFTRTSTRH